MTQINFKATEEESNMIDFLKDKLDEKTRTKVMKKCLKIVYQIKKNEVS